MRTSSLQQLLLVVNKWLVADVMEQPLEKRLCNILLATPPIFASVCCFWKKNMTMKQKLENHGFDLTIHFIFASKLHHCQIGWYIAVQWFWAVKGLTPCTAHTSMHVLLTSDKCAALIFMRSLVPNVCKRSEFKKFFPCCICLFPFFCSYQHTDFWTFYGLITPCA